MSFSILPEELQAHLLSKLTSLGFLSCSITCSKIHTISKKMSASWKGSQYDRQREMIKETFQCGQLEILLWLQKKLNYPEFYPSWWFTTECLSLAGAGINMILANF